MYIAETLINSLFTDVAFHSEGDGSGHYESGGHVPPSPVPSARLCPADSFQQRNTMH